MATIGKLNYIISANTASFVRAMVASRSEATTQRKILEQMRSPLDDWSDAQAKLVKMLYSGKLTTEQYNFAMQKLGEQHPAVQARQRALTDAERTASGIRSQLAGKTGEYNRKLAEAKRALDAGTISTQEYRRYQAQLRAEASAGVPVLGSLAKAFANPAVIASVAAFGAVRLAISGVRSAVQALNQELTAIDQITKTAQQLGVAEESLVGLRFAAGQTGVEANVLDKSLTKLAQKSAEAAQGNAEASATFRALGIDVAALAGLRPDEQFRFLASAMDNVTNANDRVRIAVKLFGEEGVSLINTLALGEQGLATMQQRAEQLGLTFDRLDAAGVEAANDAIAEAKLALTGMVRIVAVDLAPLIAASATTLTDLFLEFRASLQGTSVAAGQVTRDVSGLTETIIAIVDKLQDVWRLLRVIKSVGEASNPFTAWKELQAVMRGEMPQFGKDIEQLLDPGRTWGEQLQARVRAAQSAMREAAANRPMVAGGLAPQVSVAAAGAAGGVAESAKSLQEQTNELVDSLQEQIRYVGKTADETARLKLEARGLSPEWLRVIGAMQQQLSAGQRMAEARGEVERMNQALREQIATQRLAARGWSPEQIERWKLAQRGAGAEQLQQLAVLQQHAGALQKQQTLEASLAETRKRLKEQRDTAGMSQQELELYKLAQQGASREQLAQVAWMQQQALAAANTKQGTGLTPRALPTATIAGTREAAERIAAYRDRQAEDKDKTSWERQLSIQERIAVTLDKILNATGLTVEEATV